MRATFQLVPHERIIVQLFLIGPSLRRVQNVGHPSQMQKSASYLVNATTFSLANKCNKSNR
jgi:hypothetical protein